MFKMYYFLHFDNKNIQFNCKYYTTVFHSAEHASRKRWALIQRVALLVNGEIDGFVGGCSGRDMGRVLFAKKKKVLPATQASQLTESLSATRVTAYILHIVRVLIHSLRYSDALCYSATSALKRQIF